MDAGFHLLLFTIRAEPVCLFSFLPASDVRELILGEVAGKLGNCEKWEKRETPAGNHLFPVSPA